MKKKSLYPLPKKKKSEALVVRYVHNKCSCVPHGVAHELVEDGQTDAPDQEPASKGLDVPGEVVVGHPIPHHRDHNCFYIQQVGVLGSS